MHPRQHLQLPARTSLTAGSVALPAHGSITAKSVFGRLAGPLSLSLDNERGQMECEASAARMMTEWRLI